jgi:hypothetical protein
MLCSLALSIAGIFSTGLVSAAARVVDERLEAIVARMSKSAQRAEQLNHIFKLSQRVQGLPAEVSGGASMWLYGTSNVRLCVQILSGRTPRSYLLDGEFDELVEPFVVRLSVHTRAVVCAILTCHAGKPDPEEQELRPIALFLMSDAVIVARLERGPENTDESEDADDDVIERWVYDSMIPLGCFGASPASGLKGFPEGEACWCHSRRELTNVCCV